jgi:hypothetical protein
VRTTEYGWDYAIRFVVDWQDIETGAVHKAKTPTMLAAFPRDGMKNPFDSRGAERLFENWRKRETAWQLAFDGSATEIGSAIQVPRMWHGDSDVCPDNTVESSINDRYGPCRFEKQGAKISEARPAGRSCFASTDPTRVCLITSGCPKPGRVLKPGTEKGKFVLFCE